VIAYLVISIRAWLSVFTKGLPTDGLTLKAE